MQKLKSVLLVTTWLGAVFSSANCFAQTADQSTAQADNDASEIVVTAQRRSERIQDVPVSVSALSGASLAAANVSTLEDLSAQVPSLVATTATGYGQAPLAIRGVGGANGGANVFADEPVAVYVDGVFQTGLGGVAGDLLDIGNLRAH
jgi:iron complex outermembrane recepter protein